MSMHEIERLVEVSVITAAAEPLPSTARDICYSLYCLQDLFDCGYTLLRVPEELERAGYLFRLPVQRLPEPERTHAMESHESYGFFADETYFDRETGLVCVTAGSPLWQRLCDLGILANPENRPPRKMDLLELAEALFPLAAKALTAGKEYGAETLGLWYAIFPAFCMAVGDEEPDQQRIAPLLELAAIPEAFVHAEPYMGGVEMEDMAEESPFYAHWCAPYMEWRKHTADTRQIVSLTEGGAFEQAMELAAALPDTFSRAYYRSYVSVSYYQRAKTQPDSLSLPERLLSPEEAQEELLFLQKQDLRPDQVIACSLYLCQCQILLGEPEAALDAFKQACKSALSSLGDFEGNACTHEAFIALSFYLLLDAYFPTAFPGKDSLLEGGLPGTLTLPETRQVLEALSAKQPEEYEFYDSIAQCYLLEKNIPKAREVLGKALGINPEDRAALDLLQSIGNC